MTTTAGKWFEIDSRKGQVYLVGAATRELAFEYHDKGYIALEANLGFEDGKTISFLQGGNTVTATDDENGFSEDNIGKYIYTGDGWHKILSVSDVTIVGCGKNLLPPRLAQTVAGVTYTPQSDGTYIANGTCTGTSTFEILPSCVLPPGKYALSGGNGGISLILAVYDAQGGWLENLATSRNGVAAVVQIEALSGNEAYHRVIFQGTSGAEVNNVVLSPQLEVGDTATAFEPYEDIPFLSIDNAQGQIESVAVETGCRARQAGTGEPSPENIRAITGRDSVEIATCGKNLLRIPPALGPATGASAVEVSGDGYTVSVTGSGAYAQAAIIYANVIPGREYTISAGSISGGNGPYVTVQKPDRTGIAQINATTPQAAFVPDDSRVIVIFVANGSGMALESPTTATFNGMMVEEGDTATEYEPYRSTGGGTVTPTEPLYGLPGAEDTVDVSVDGDVTVTRRTAVHVLDGTGAVDMQQQGGYNRFVIYNAVPGIAVSGESYNAKIILSHYAVVRHAGPIGGNLVNNAACDYQGTSWLFVRDDAHASAEEYRAWLAQQYAAGTPVTIVYELAAPGTETPADIDPIEPNTGDVNVFTDADSLNITLYKTENNKYASVTGSFSQPQNDFASMLTQMNEINISGEDVELTKLEIDYVPQVR